MSNKEYEFCCSLIWGNIVLDKNWAMKSKLFQEESEKILNKYPKLDFDFFKEYNEDEV